MPTLLRRRSLAALLALGAGASALPAIRPPVLAPLPEAAATVEPALEVAASLEAPPAAAAGARAAELERFASGASGWRASWDRRSDRPHLIWGPGVPLLPGRGNRLDPVAAGLAPGAAPDLDDAARVARAFAVEWRELLGLEGIELELDREASGVARDPEHADRSLWSVTFRQVHAGLPVVGASAFFRIAQGNLVQFGTDRLAPVSERLTTVPALGAEEALARALAALGLRADDGALEAPAALELRPALTGGEVPGERFAGVPGAGYEHRLTWKLRFRPRPLGESVAALVDAETGAILDLRLTTLWATVSGGIYPRTNIDPEELRPFPFATVINGGAKVTDAAGEYPYEGGSASAALDGRYVRIDDECGAISLADAATGDLAFGAGGGTDCATPGIGGAGNTHAARTAFYHLTRINRKASGFLPGNVWLDGTVTANTNVANTCNAAWDGTTMHYFRSGGGCSNAGEIAAIVLHEWGHGIDKNTGDEFGEQGSSEALGDTFAVLETRDACFGPNFRPGSPCHNCRASCTGIRDLLPFTTGGSGVVASPANARADAGIDCDRYACPYWINPLFPYQGPMGYEGHCESYIASTANWDLAEALVDSHGAEAGWSEMDRIWYGSLLPSQSAYRLVSGGKCNPAAAIDGCLASNWYTVFLAADDDDGNLANGTPNGCRIWDAFTDHGIACGTRPACTFLFGDDFESADLSHWDGAAF